MSDLLGKWNVYDAKFEPHGPMDPEDQGMVRDRFGYEDGGSWFEFREGGELRGELLGIECEGRWAHHDSSLTVLEWSDQGELGITPEFARAEGGIVLRFAWQNGEMQLSLEKPGTSGLSGSVKARIREIWDNVVECDDFDAAEIGAILDTAGGAAAVFMHGAQSDIWMLGAVLSADHFDLARRLVEMGATPNDETLSTAKHRVRYSRHLAKAEAFLAFIEARLSSGTPT
ncbi:MAG: hypothetical protein AB8H86_33305 [Polyangiales bacterium]